jgi:hypothetical protein
MPAPFSRRWTCSLRVDGSERAYATFSSVVRAKEFAEAVARRRGRSGCWVESGWGWVLSIAQAEYLVRPA